MKKIFIILGNGFTIDFLNHYKKFAVINNIVMPNIDVTNLMLNGEKIRPPWDSQPGFLSYKNCPALWTLGARPYQSDKDSSDLIEEIISCANMFFDFVHDKGQKQQRISMLNEINNKIYLRAYCELLTYIQQLFSYYNSEIQDNQLKKFVENYDDWGWKKFFNRLFNTYDEAIFVTYNYDIWLERLLSQQSLKFTIIGLENTNEKIKIIKPHGSISFVPIQYETPVQINYNLNLDGEIDLQKFKVSYRDLNNYISGAIIPPAGDSMRLEMSTSWAKRMREEAICYAKRIAMSADTDIILCGISYWYMDRHEIDELLVNLNHKSNLIFINPHPPRDLNAVLSSIFENYILQTTSDNIGGICNG